MSSFFNCVAYDDIESTIRLQDNVIFLALKDKNKDTDVHLTLNPFQVRTLVNYLSFVLLQIDFDELVDENHFGDLNVEIEKEDTEAEADYAMAVPF